MAEQIAVITTGGTIGSVLSGASVSVDPTGVIVQDEIAKICKRNDLDVAVTQALNKHSEDLTVADWGEIARAVRRKLDEGVKRIVITHGTDTLAYTSAACALLFGSSEARICLTGSFHSLEAPNSDGPLNLIAAFGAVSADELPNGVYVAFRASERNTQASIIPALLLKPMPFDGLFFEGSYGDRVAAYGPKIGFDIQNILRPLSLPVLAGDVPSADALSAAARKVLQVSAYPGLALDAFAPAELSALVVSLYHSGTACTSDAPGSFVPFLRKNAASLPVFFSAFPARYISKPYESTVKLVEAGGIVVRDLQPHAIFVLLVLALAQGRSVADVKRILEPWCLTF